MSNPEFRRDRLASIATAEEAHPWFVARRALVAGLVARERSAGPGRLVDVGCGTGRTLADIAGPADDSLGLDLLAGQSHAVGGRDDIVYADARELPLETGWADVVLALDVLEHVVEHDVAAGELVRVAAPGGLVVVTVPAHAWLWSHRDDDAGHVRRYSRSSLIEVLSDAGLELTQVAWFAGATLPPLAVMRLLGRSWSRLRDLEERPGDGAVGRILLRTLLAEAGAVVRGGGPVVGSSLVAVGRA